MYNIEVCIPCKYIYMYNTYYNGPTSTKYLKWKNEEPF